MNDLRHDHDEGLSPAARAALRALRAEDELPAAVRERMWARLAAGPAARAPGRARWQGAAVGLALAAGLALTVVALGRGAQPLTERSRGAAARYDGGAAHERAAAGGGAVELAAGTGAGELAAGTGAGELAAGTGAGARRPARGERAAVREATPADSSSLAAEAALLQRAQTALAAGEPAAALARLGEHARGFADGVLARERDALRVTALCAAGRRAEGRAEAAAFLRAHPDTLLAERVRGACAGR